MPALVNFTDFYNSCSQKMVTGPKQIRHAAQQARYGWAYCGRGKPTGSMLRIGGGNQIAEKVILQDASTFATYSPNDALTIPMPQVTATATAKWAFGHDKIAWTKNEEVLNGQSAYMSEEGRVAQYYDLMTKLETQVQVSSANGLETKFTAIPNANTMESSSGSEPYSMFALVNEFPNSLYVNNSVAFSTKHGLTPTSGAHARFRSHVFGYNVASISPTGTQKNLLNALDSANVRLNYVSPLMAGIGWKAPQNWEESGWPNKISFWSFTGVEKIMDLLRQRNQTWAQTNEVGLMGPVYNGMELIPLPALESAAIYPSDSYTTNASPVTEGSASALGGGPRGYIIDNNGFQTVFNSEVFGDRTEVRQLDNQPFTRVVWLDYYYQFMVTAPWLCGVVAPGTVAGTFPSLTYTPTAAVYTY